MSFVYLSIAILGEVIGTLSLRLASDGRKAYLLGVLVCYPLAFFMLVRALDAGLGLGVAYGIWSAVGVVLTALASRVLFREAITRRMAAGMGLIAAGVLLIELGSSH